jgi:hypothetical protein
MEYYSGRLFTMQDIRGRSENYNDLRRTYQISIIGDWAMFRDEEFLHEFQYYDPKRALSLDGRHDRKGMVGGVFPVQRG